MWLQYGTLHRRAIEGSRSRAGGKGEGHLPDLCLNPNECNTWNCDDSGVWSCGSSGRASPLHFSFSRSRASQHCRPVCQLWIHGTIQCSRIGSCRDIEPSKRRGAAESERGIYNWLTLLISTRRKGKSSLPLRVHTRTRRRAQLFVPNTSKGGLQCGR